MNDAADDRDPKGRQHEDGSAGSAGPPGSAGPSGASGADGPSGEQGTYAETYGNPARERSRGSISDVTTEGVYGRRPDRAALVGGQDLRPGGQDGHGGQDGQRRGPGGRRRGKRGRRGGGGEATVVPEARFTPAPGTSDSSDSADSSYYGRPILNLPSWSQWDIGGYFFLGGLAGAGSVLAGAAELTRRPRTARALKVSSTVAIAGSAAALVHDLGRPSRFANMLRVLKPTSPMSVGSWLLAGYGPLSGAAAVSDLTGLLPRAGRTATVGAALLGPAVAAYTAVLAADTAVPGWHEGYRELPFVFTGSAATAASGMALVAAPAAEAGPARSVALAGAGLENAAMKAMERRLGVVAETYRSGRAGRLLRAAEALSAVGTAGAAGSALLRGRRGGRTVAAASGLALLAASACTRLGVFHAGLRSAEDPKYTVLPQRERLRNREQEQQRQQEQQPGDQRR